MIPIYIISRVIEERFFTPLLLVQHNIPFHLIVDSEDQRTRAMKLGCKNVYIGPSTSVSDKRNYVTSLNNDWFISMDDNIRDFTTVQKKYWKRNELEVTDTTQNWRKIYRTPCPAGLFVERLNELIDECIRVKTVYGGIATNENPYFRARKYSYRRFVKGKVYVMKGGAGIVFKNHPVEDTYASALTVAKYGCVVVNNFLHYTARWYEKGGFGTRKMREEKGLLEKIQAVIDEFPGLVTQARGQNSACRFVLTNDKTVNEWRRNHGFLGGSLL